MGAGRLSELEIQHLLRLRSHLLRDAATGQEPAFCDADARSRRRAAVEESIASPLVRKHAIGLVMLVDPTRKFAAYGRFPTKSARAGDRG